MAGHARIEDYAHAIRTAAVFVKGDGPDGESSRRAVVHHCQILLDESGQLRQAAPSKIFIPMVSHQQSNLLRLVSDELMAQQGVFEALEVIGIKEATPSLELTAFVREGLRSGSNNAWNSFWKLVRSFAEASEALTIITNEFGNRLPAVRTLSGHYHPLPQTLLPGSVVPNDGSRDREVTIDVDFHESDLEIIRLMGAGQAPGDGYPILRDKVVDTYRESCISAYIDLLPVDSPRPQWDRMVFDRKTHVGPLEPLQYLSEEGRAAFTEELVKATGDWRDWTLKHETQRIYRPMGFSSAAVWAMKKDGRLRTNHGITRVGCAWGEAFRQWSEIASVVTWLPAEVAVRLDIPQDVHDLQPEHWHDAFRGVTESTNDSIIGNFYAFAARAGIAVPHSLRCRIGATHATYPPAAVAVTNDREAFAALRDLERPAILVSTPDESRILVDTWKLIPATTIVRQETQWVESDAPTTLADAFPTLRADLQDAGLADLEIVACADIFDVFATERGTQVISKDFEKIGDRFLWGLIH